MDYERLRGFHRQDHMDVLNRYKEYKVFWDRHRIPGEYRTKELLWEDPWIKANREYQKNEARKRKERMTPKKTDKVERSRNNSSNAHEKTSTTEIEKKEKTPKQKNDLKNVKREEVVKKVKKKEVVHILPQTTTQDSDISKDLRTISSSSSKTSRSSSTSSSDSSTSSG